ncbi:MAG: hypothetical protein ACRERU_18860 [Methylococcales bacterium]
MVNQSFSKWLFSLMLLAATSSLRADELGDIAPALEPVTLDPVAIPSVDFQPLSVGRNNPEFIPVWVEAQVNGKLKQLGHPVSAGPAGPQHVSVEAGRGANGQLAVNICSVNAASAPQGQPTINLCIVNGLIVEGR